jgi:hypothetical protein
MPPGQILRRRQNFHLHGGALHRRAMTASDANWHRQKFAALGVR